MNPPLSLEQLAELETLLAQAVARFPDLPEAAVLPKPSVDSLFGGNSRDP